MNLKALKEKRHSLLGDLNSMVEAIENEVRSLSDEEVSAFNSKKEEIERIDADIKRVEELRALSMGEDAVKELEEKRNVEEEEKRALENFLRGHDLNAEEKRALQATQQTAFIPTSIHKTIIEKLMEQCPILDKAKRFSTKGTLRLIKESTLGDAAITAEYNGAGQGAFTVADPTFNSVELKAYKVATAVQITFEMLANSDIDLSGYLSDLVVKRLAIQLNKLFVSGDGAAKPQGILHYAKNNIPAAQKVEVSVGAGGLIISDIIKLQTSVNPYFLNGSVFVMNRKTFQEVAGMLDAMGRPYLSHDLIGDKIVYRLLGLEIIVDENMENVQQDNTPIIMVNLGEAYAINMVKEITVKHMTEKGFTSGYEEFGAYVLADGKVVNEQAIACIKMTV